jgi:hypothetical protein
MTRAQLTVMGMRPCFVIGIATLSGRVRGSRLVGVFIAGFRGLGAAGPIIVCSLAGLLTMWRRSSRFRHWGIADARRFQWLGPGLPRVVTCHRRRDWIVCLIINGHALRFLRFVSTHS